MTDSQPDDIFTRAVAAAATGDKAALAVLAALERVANQGTPTAADLGRAEARRRFGVPTEQAAQAGVSALTGAERGRAEARRRFGPIPGDSA